MNTLKPLVVVAVLAGIGYGVYTRINTSPSAPPPGVTPGWETPDIQMPAVPGMPEQGTPGLAANGAAHGGFAPPSASGGVAAQPGALGAATVVPPVALGASAAGGLNGAPPYESGAGGGQTLPASGAPPAGYPAPPYNGNNNPDAPGYPNATQPNPTQPNAAQPGAQPNPGLPPPYAGGPFIGNAAPSATEYSPIPGAGGTGIAPVAPSVADNGQVGSVPTTAGVETATGAGGQVPPDANAAVPAPTAADFAQCMQASRREMEAGNLAQALAQLSPWYDNPVLSPSEQDELNKLLDQVAGSVVYSTQHHMEAPYEVQPGERLEDIARQYSVPWQLLAKINGISDPQELRPGERLKVVRGPFTAVVSLDKRQLTLMLNGAYAGRFPIGIGRDMPVQEGMFEVKEKVVNPTYYSANRAINADDPANPLGERWLGLGNQLGIHGTNDENAIPMRSETGGCISLSARDAEDVFDILSEGSKVVIRR